MVQRIIARVSIALTVSSLCYMLDGCTHSRRDGPPRYNIDVSRIPDAVPKKEPKSAYGNMPSYKVFGRRYHVLHTAHGYHARGIASWYGTKFDGQLTSTRERYNMLGMTAASPVLPIPCYVRVTNLKNHRTIVVRVNDRGPFAPNRILDLSYVGAKKLGYIGHGTAYVQVDAINTQDYNAPIYAHHTPTREYRALPSHAAAHEEAQPATGQHASYSPERTYLQVGAFNDLARAENLKQQISSVLDKPVRITTMHHGSPRYKVQVGPLHSDIESSQVREQLTHDGYHAIAVTS